MIDRIHRFGLIGAGAIAQVYAQVFENFPAGRVVAVADTRPEATRALAERLGCLGFSNHEALLSQCDVDALIVCTPPITHPDICLAGLTMGKHVLCEKPLSIDVAGAKQMIATAREAGVILTMASKFRYVEDVVRAKSILASGILGEVGLFENAFTSWIDMSGRWNSRRQISGGGVLIDNGTHSVDIARYFLGPVAAVRVVEGQCMQGLAVEETVNLFMRSRDGVTAHADLSWSLDKALPGYISIYGTHGTVRVGWKESRYRQTANRDWVVFGRGYDKFQAFRAQLLNFCRAIQGDEPLLITAEDALASVQVIEAAYQALGRDEWTAVPNGQAETTVLQAGRASA